MTGWNVDPGIWEITQGVDTNGDDAAASTTFGARSTDEGLCPPMNVTLLSVHTIGVGAFAATVSLAPAPAKVWMASNKHSLAAFDRASVATISTGLSSFDDWD